MKPFGQGSMGYEAGYTLPLLVGWIEDLAAEEAGRLTRLRGPKAKRLAKVEDALQLLNEVLEQEPE